MYVENVAHPFHIGSEKIPNLSFCRNPQLAYKSKKRVTDLKQMLVTHLT